jgi:hypothetical protein
MLAFLGERLSRRKQVLLACATFFDSEDQWGWERPAYVTAEKFVDGDASRAEINVVWASVRQAHADDRGRVLNLLRLARGKIKSLLEIPRGMLCDRPFSHGGSAREANLVRDVFGNPFRSVSFDPSCLTRNDGRVRKMAQVIYDERRFADLPILADALEEADCTDRAVLDHCRGPGPHIRGCFVIDAILGKT